MLKKQVPKAGLLFQKQPGSRPCDGKAWTVGPDGLQ